MMNGGGFISKAHAYGNVQKVAICSEGVCVALMFVGTQCCTLKVINSNLIKV